MIDIHCHILPQVDDGAKSVEEAVEMAKIAQSEGIKKIVTTPHYHPTFDFKRGKELVHRVNDFNELLKKESLDIEVILGNEIYYSEDYLEILDNKEFYTLNNSKYLLIEFPPLRFPKNIIDVVYEIKLRGYTPVLAHVERYKEVQENPNLIYDCIEEGAIIQVNASSTLGKNGNVVHKTCDILLDNNMVHVVGTDAHSSTRRRPLIKEAYNFVAKEYGEKRARELFIDNSEAIINNEDLAIENPSKYVERKGFFARIFKR